MHISREDKDKETMDVQKIFLILMEDANVNVKNDKMYRPIINGESKHNENKNNRLDLVSY